MEVAGVIGYPAKKVHPAAIAARAIASLPSRKLLAICCRCPVLILYVEKRTVVYIPTKSVHLIRLP